MSIKKQIEARKREIFTKVDGNVREIAHDLFTQIQGKTPVDTGEARRNWSIAEINTGHYVISNPLPYIEALEYGLYPQSPKNGKGKTKGGYSIQAPKGFIRLSIMEVSSNWRYGKK